MKQFLLILTVLSFIATLTSRSQDTIKYSYDAAGNRISRNIIHIGGGSKGAATSNEKVEKAKEIKDLTFNPLTIKIYPNPTRGLLIIEVPEVPDSNPEIQIKVTDMNGRLIFHKKNVPIRTEINLDSQPNGLYILHIVQGKVVSKWKIVKQ